MRKKKMGGGGVIDKMNALDGWRRACMQMVISVPESRSIFGIKESEPNLEVNVEPHANRCLRSLNATTALAESTF
jgi:hypothetical protein